MEKIIIILSLFGLSRSFVLDSTSAPSVISSHNFEQLVDLLLDEKHSRNQLGQEVEALRSQLAAQTKAMEKELAAHSDMMEQQNNQTKSEIDILNQAFNKERSNRHQLEHEYAKLMMDHTAMMKKNTDLEMEVKNLSSDRDYLQEKVQNLTLKQEEFTKLNIELDKRVKDLTREALKDRMKLIETTNNVMVVNRSLSAVHAQAASNQASIGTYHSVLLELKRKQGHRSGFTAWAPTSSLTTGTITFKNITSNIGNHYNSTTGVFTCAYPGVYFFALSLYEDHQYTACNIRHNGMAVMRIASPGSDSGFYQASNSVFLRLNISDRVDLGNCYTFSTMDQLTSFSGFLISSD